MRKRKTTTLSEIPCFYKLMQSLQIIPQYYISKLSYNSTYYLRFFLPKMDLQVGTTFNNITEAKIAIKTFVANAAESWKATHSDKKKFISVNNSVLVASEFELLTQRRKVFLSHI
jgi:hypothetical protein